MYSYRLLQITDRLHVTQQHKRTVTSYSTYVLSKYCSFIYLLLLHVVLYTTILYIWYVYIVHIYVYTYMVYICTLYIRTTTAAMPSTCTTSSMLLHTSNIYYMYNLQCTVSNYKLTVAKQYINTHGMYVHISDTVIL